MYSFYTARQTRLHAGIYWGHGEKGGQAVVQNGVDRIREYGLDFGARSYLTPRHTLAGCYVLYGLRAGGLVWHFANPVQVPAAGVDETITKDAVLVFTPYLGLGLSVLQVKPLHIGASVCWGPRISLDKTFEEFENDLFPTVAEVRWTLGLSVFF